MADTKTTDTETKPSEAPTAAKEVAQKPQEPIKAPTKAEKEAKAEPCFALMTINGKIAPGTMFRPDNQAMRVELDQLKAVRDLEPAEAALFAQLEANSADDTSDDNLG